MTTGGKILLGAAVVGVGVLSFFIYKWNVPPVFTAALTSQEGVYAITFGKFSGSTGGNGTGDAGYGWGIQFTGNNIVIIKNVSVYKTFTINSVGVITI